MVEHSKVTAEGGYSVLDPWAASGVLAGWHPPPSPEESAALSEGKQDLKGVGQPVGTAEASLGFAD